MFCKFCGKQIEYEKCHCSQARQSAENKTDDFLISAAIGAVTDSALIGGIVGGDFLGGVVGDFLNGSSIDD